MIRPKSARPGTRRWPNPARCSSSSWPATTSHAPRRYASSARAHNCRAGCTLADVATTIQFEVDVADVEYQRLAGQAWLARVYRPVGSGPFPVVVDVHGGA